MRRKDAWQPKEHNVGSHGGDVDKDESELEDMGVVDDWSGSSGNVNEGQGEGEEAAGARLPERDCQSKAAGARDCRSKAAGARLPERDCQSDPAGARWLESTMPTQRRALGT